ncbi:hypothetical protein V6N13_054631 [Hibiscus sabdariffa]|uniref:Uncharacterized protein n=1 Tax=Hibiscus sabdariffa TaxID=183260 RepID=A0ABR2DYW6_9ROSI
MSPGFDPSTCRNVYVENSYSQVNEPPLQEVFVKKSVADEALKYHVSNLDYWREYRAILYKNFDESEKTDPSRLGKKWAHPLSLIESGCVIVATDKLDGDSIHGRFVVLIYRYKKWQGQEG